LVPTLFGPWAAEVVERAAPQPGEAVLDVGCGTGPAARFTADLVKPSGNVIGLDLDAGMLEVARLSAEREGRQVDWRQADVTEMPFADLNFDVVFCCQGLQFFPDKLTALQEMRRVLKSDGRLAASIWRDVTLCPGHLAVSQALAQQSGSTPAPMPPFSLANANEIKSLVQAAGYREIDIASVRKISSFKSASEFVDVLAAGAPSTRKALQSLDEEKKADVISSVTKALEEFTDSHGLQLPMESHILMARA
jgi:SAM-dependent methyltransferase